MAFTCKRPAASLDGHASQPGAMCRKRRRVIGTTYDYDQESCLGRGKFGAVVKARCRATGQVVAIKSLHDPADPREVLREARFLEACGGHPHIVGFRGVTLDYVTDELCLVMDYVEGKSLKLLLSERSGGLPEATVCTFMWQLLTAAKKMHRCHVVHRDINPANILVGGEEAGRGFVKICDLGVAMSMSEAPPYEEEAGMGEYRAPEMLLGKEDYDALVDTWSLGCVMAEMLTGERIFRAAEFISLFQRIFEVVGVPDDTTWPGFTSLPHAAPPPLVPGQQSTLRDLFPEEVLSAEGFQVLNGLLTCNPDKRLTATAALKLPWFATAAANARPSAPTLLLLLLPRSTRWRCP
ncbi:Putative cyclin-dependent kinase F-2 [Triticum urartu]|uniref:[RNA-polymerase]-subunit kinase n=1 Tax=Triticum urartu TaxID=4572 RepID=M7YNB8_TRIUA|nr:Putative cyclin-dependent kinase F-2 [Triticum urartu]